MLVLYAGEQTMKVFSNGCIMGGVSCYNHNNNGCCILYEGWRHKRWYYMLENKL